MKTGTRSGHKLNPVADQDDPALRYRIYEATERNWLDTPEPVIYRNGVVVDASEYILQAPYGVVVFHEQQNSTDNITADFTHILGASNKIETLDNNISTLQRDLGTAQSDISELDTRVTTLETSGGGATLDGVVPFYNVVSGSYISHMRQDYNPLIGSEDETSGDWVVSYNPNTHRPAFNILVRGGTMDAFPLPISKEITVSQAAIMLGSATPYPVRTKIGLYKDNGNMYPGELVFSAHDIITNPGEWGTMEVNVTIPPGLYWLVRLDKSDSYYNGLTRDSALSINKFDAVKFLQELADRPNPHTSYGGYRATDVAWTDDASLPEAFPSGVGLFSREFYCSPWLVVG